MAIVCLEEPDKPASLRIVAINPAAAQVSDVPTAAIGKRLDQDFPEIAQTRFPELVTEVLRTGVARDLGEGPGVYSPDRAFTVKAFPIPPNCVGLVFEDVTERRKSEQALRETEQRYRKIFDASTVAICIFEPDTGTLLDANPRFASMIGAGTATELLGRRLESLGMWTSEDDYAALIQQLRRQRSIREATVTYRTQVDQVRRALVALELIEVEGLECVLGIFWRV